MAQDHVGVVCFRIEPLLVVGAAQLAAEGVFSPRDGDTEPVDLAPVAEQSWQVVETENAALRVEDDVRIEANPPARPARP